MLIRLSFHIRYKGHEVWLEKCFGGDVPPAFDSIDLGPFQQTFHVRATTWYPDTNEVWMGLSPDITPKTEALFWETVKEYIDDGWLVNDGNSAYITRKHLLEEELRGITVALNEPNTEKET